MIIQVDKNEKNFIKLLNILTVVNWKSEKHLNFHPELMYSNFLKLMTERIIHK